MDARTANNASGWVRQGFLKTTPGKVTDYAWIKKQIMEDVKNFQVEAIGYDKWNSSQLVNDLEADQVPMVQVSQTISQLSAPLKEIERLVLTGTTTSPMLRHGGNPVLRWMAGNARVYMDVNGNIRPDKKKSTEKIDGISAMVMAMGVCMGSEEYVVSYGDLTFAGGA